MFILAQPTWEIYLLPASIFKTRNIAMLIREPELGYNTENKRVPRGGRARAFYYSGSYETGHGSGGKVLQQKREAKDELMIEETTKVALHSKAWWVNLLNGFAEMTDPVSSDLALFLY